MLTIYTPYYLLPNELQNDSIGFSVFFVPHETNPYRTLNYVSNDALDMDPDSRGNYHFGNANQTDLHAFVVPQQLRVLRSDFWGYFNRYNNSATTYSLTSTLDYMYNPGLTWLGFYPPVMRIENKQVLRLSPFGLIQKYLMCGSTKTNISRVYGNWKRDENGYYYEDQGDGSGNREMTISSCASPYGLDSVSTNDRGGFQSVRIDQDSGGSFLACGSTPSKGFPEVSEIHPQLLVGEVLALRKEMEIQSKALKHLQKQEQQFKDLETLLKEFYLDMDLVDTKEVDPDTMALLSLPTMDTRPPIGWTRRLIRAMSISQRHKAVDGHPESDTIGLSANAQEMAGQTQWDAPPPSFSRATGGDVGVSSDTIRLQQLARKD
ncbi:hypothetical protein BGX20_011036 [Mortierella sp. AD010]|nr:hypothetical protein BGX20_011036 [Mortierella sp. AD010]